MPAPRTRLCAFRLFRAWRIERRFRPGHDRTLARRRNCRHRFADGGSADPRRVEHGRLDHAARGAGAAGARAGLDRHCRRAGLHRRSAAAPALRSAIARDRGEGARHAALGLRSRRLPLYQGADRRRQPQPGAARRDCADLPGAAAARHGGRVGAVAAEPAPRRATRRVRCDGDPGQGRRPPPVARRKTSRGWRG